MCNNSNNNSSSLLRLSLLASSGLVILSILLSSCSPVVESVPLDLGGGVFSSDNAKDYFTSRFGSGFFAGLANLQKANARSSSGPVVLVDDDVRPQPAQVSRASRQRNNNNNRQRVPSNNRRRNNPFTARRRLRTTTTTTVPTTSVTTTTVPTTETVPAVAATFDMLPAADLNMLAQQIESFDSNLLSGDYPEYYDYELLSNEV